MDSFLLILHLGLCAGLFYACFCRLTKTDFTTHVALRLSIFLESVAALGLFFAAIAWGFKPNYWTSGLMASTVYYMWVNREIWREGVPGWAQPIIDKIRIPDVVTNRPATN